MVKISPFILLYVCFGARIRVKNFSAVRNKSKRHPAASRTVFDLTCKSGTVLRVRYLEGRAVIAGKQIYFAPVRHPALILRTIV